ncbi:BICD family-like cargo adapter 2 [Pelodytes ibericus]
MSSGGTESRGAVPRGWNGGLASPSMEEHFYPFLLDRRNSYLGEEEEQGEEDLSLELEKKDKDLLLAAELGKALLERTDQLERGREALEEELRETRERLEQERHDMRLKMEVLESEWRAQVMDLENDLAEANFKMRQAASVQRESGRETASAVQELSEQNQRLLEQITQASQLERSLTAELQHLREENRELTLSRGHFTPCLQSLQSENALLLEKKRELELQIKDLREQNESANNMVFSLKESTLRQERETAENEAKMQQLQFEVQELRDSQRRLQIQVRELQEEQHMRDGQQSMCDSYHSLHSEIQQSTAGLGHQFGLGPDGIPYVAADPLEMDLTQREGDLLLEREEEVTRLQNQVTQQYMELNSLREELQRLREVCEVNDHGTGQSDRDEAILRQAVSDRDEAILRQRELEMELSKCALEKESLSCQLLSAVQQKVMLSQELEAWQDDMQIVISQQLKTQRVQETQKDSEAPPLSPSRRDNTKRSRDTGSGILSFLKRM